MKEYKIKLFRGNEFCHNVYITCEKIERLCDFSVKADGVRIDFILGIGSIEENI